MHSTGERRDRCPGRPGRDPSSDRRRGPRSAPRERRDPRRAARREPAVPARHDRGRRAWSPSSPGASRGIAFRRIDRPSPRAPRPQRRSRAPRGLGPGTPPRQRRGRGPGRSRRDPSRDRGPGPRSPRRRRRVLVVHGPDGDGRLTAASGPDGAFDRAGASRGPRPCGSSAPIWRPPGSRRRSSGPARRSAC